MSEASLVAIIVAVIAAGGSVLGQWLISRKQNSDRRLEEAKRDVRIEDRLQAVEKKLDIHNGYAEKFASIGADSSVIKNDIKTLYKLREG
jgi:hypothetical protein